MCRLEQFPCQFPVLQVVADCRSKQSITFLLNSPLSPEINLNSSNICANTKSTTIEDMFAATTLLLCAAGAASGTTSPSGTVSDACSMDRAPPSSLLLPVARRGCVQKRRKKVSTLQCEACKRLFADAATLRKHKRVVHGKVKNFTCDECQRSFAEKSNLKKHVIALHKKERPHECDMCDKSFNFTDGLRRHLNNCHLGLRPYDCTLCGSSFKQRTHLQKHLSSIHNVDKTR